MIGVVILIALIAYIGVYFIFEDSRYYYWSAVIGQCAWLLACSFFARSVANTVARHAQALSLTNRQAGGGSGGLLAFAWVWKVFGIGFGLAGIAGAVAVFSDYGFWITFSVILCGAIWAVQSWGLGCIFAVQSWSEGAAKEIAFWIAMENRAKSDETERL